LSCSPPKQIHVCPIWPPDVRKRYEQAVRNIDLLVCGAGAEHGLLFTWLKSNARIVLPAGAVGDLCLVPISADGSEVPLARRAPQRVREVLNPHPACAVLNCQRLLLMVAEAGGQLPF
jgi:hypothetical protein